MSEEQKIQEELQELGKILENDEKLTDEQFFEVSGKVLELRHKLRLIMNGEVKSYV